MSGSVALGLITAGALLIFWECNRPGYILPGAFGLLSLLLGANRLQPLTSWHDATLWTAGAGVALIGLSRWRSLLGAPAIFGTGLLTTASLSLARRSGGEINLAGAAACGLLLGTTSSVLMILAGQAWRAKSGHFRASTDTARTGGAEQWGVD